ncbi:MAG: hypothetical protein AAF662_02925 [Pseudomonadota bacterium]
MTDNAQTLPTNTPPKKSVVLSGIVFTMTAALLLFVVLFYVPQDFYLVLVALLGIRPASKLASNVSGVDFWQEHVEPFLDRFVH